MSLQRKMRRRQQKSAPTPIATVDPASFRAALTTFWPVRHAVERFAVGKRDLSPVDARVFAAMHSLGVVAASSPELVDVSEAWGTIVEAYGESAGALFDRSWLLASMIGDSDVAASFGFLLSSGQSSELLDAVINTAATFQVDDASTSFPVDDFGLAADAWLASRRQEVTPNVE